MPYLGIKVALGLLDKNSKRTAVKLNLTYVQKTNSFFNVNFA
ncbi:hypothetical protein SAMN05192529_11970 [Arachidicoccus rhizosphaerae]|uniref:Uncharacterized protein n=1 Tax=Arachidicoccus rhizosphaerae TaxID=551991 RepID=A0A1H4BBA3_9BACT|nr:hypothetical protein SAMN05192529_11970 [Arachidicoccus rhizosphaerae]